MPSSVPRPFGAPVEPLPIVVTPNQIRSWQVHLAEVERLHKERIKKLSEAGSVPIAPAEVDEYITRVASVRQAIDSALSDLGRVNELSESRKLAAGAVQAEAVASNAQLEMLLTEAKTKREVVGRRTDVAGQYVSDSYANALSAGALGFVAVGSAILGVSEFYRVAWPVSILPFIGVPVFWVLGLGLYYRSLMREKLNSDLRAGVLARAAQEAESNPQTPNNPRPTVPLQETGHRRG